MKITIDEHWNSWVAGLEEATVPQNILLHLSNICHILSDHLERGYTNICHILSDHLERIHNYLSHIICTNSKEKKRELGNYMFHADSISPWSFTFPMALKYDALRIALEFKRLLIHNLLFFWFDQLWL